MLADDSSPRTLRACAGAGPLARRGDPFQVLAGLRRSRWLLPARVYDEATAQAIDLRPVTTAAKNALRP